MVEESEEHVSRGFEEWVRQVSAENYVAVSLLLSEGRAD